MHNSRNNLRRFGVSFFALSLCLQGTTFSAAIAADNVTDKGAMAQVFLLPPDRESTPENVALVSKLIDDGNKAFEKNDFDKAISKFQEAYGLAREIKHSDGEGQALTAMCLFYQQKGQLPRAKELGENSIEVLANSTDKKALGEARTALARVYLTQDNVYMAMQQLQLALDAFSDLGATDSASASKVLMLGADVAIKTGHLNQALEFYEAAASFHGQAGQTKGQVYLQTRVVSILLELGYLTAALEEANKAVAAARSSGKPDEMVTALSALANAQYCLCQYSDARKTYEEAIAIKVPAQTTSDRANLLQGHAFAVAATGDFELAKQQMERVLPIIKKDGRSYQRALLENGIGVISALQNNSPTALQYLKNALDTVAVVNPRPYRLQIIVMQNLAAAEAKSGENRSAKLQYQNTLPVCKNKKFSDPVLEGRTYAGLAEVYLNLKEYADAEQAARAGIAVAEPINDDAALWRLYTCLAKAQMGTEQPANEALTSAVSYFRSPQAGDFADPNELTYPTRREDMGQELVSLLVNAGMVEQALFTAEQLKAEAFINEWHRRGGEVRVADRDIYNDMVASRAHLHAVTASGSPPSSVLKDWRDWVVRFQHVAQEDPGLARLIAPIPINMGDVMKTLQANKAAVVDYLVGRNTTIAFTIDQNRRLTALRLPTGKEDLQSQVAALLTASTKTDESARATEHRILSLLYNQLVTDDVRKALPANPDQMVVIIPDAVLYNLPFAALITPENKYLVEAHTLTMAPELNVLMDIRRSTKDLSVVVAEDKTGEDSESGQIASVLDANQVTTLNGKDAQFNNLQEQAKTTSTIHLTTAMNIPQNNPLGSVLPLQSTEKGKVTANSLFELNLPNDLVVLSNTSVNAKDFKGNGVQVFTRGLNYAGVRNVLMSLWVAPDPARTSELVEFYRGRQKGLSQAQSLRKAQMLALSKDPSPRAWAAFQLLGPGF